MHKFWIVTKQVYKKNLKSGSWLFLVVSPLFFAAIILGVGLLMNHSAKAAKLAVVNAPAAVVRVLDQSSDAHASAYTPAKAKSALQAERLDGVLTVTNTNPLTARLVTRVGGQSIDQAALQGALNQLNTQTQAGQLKLSATQLQQLLSPAKLTTRAVAIKDGKQVAKASSTDAVNRGIAFGITILMMIFMLVYGSILAQEIATEKGSRIMEMLLSAVSATTQFFGKLCGILLLLVTQLGIYAVVGAIAWPLLHRQAMVRQLLAGLDFSALLSVNGAQILLFFLVGTLSYAVLAALTGSLVANQEQVQQAVMPISILGMLGYFGALMAQAGDSPILRVASYIPFLSPSVMPVRVTMGYAPSWQGWLALGVSVAFLGLFTWFTVRVYRANVLIYKEGGFGKALRATLAMLKVQR
ncbi:ABC transporter permease [Lacticaseibacillus nasuensis]|uniref:ABC-type Na+ efflux pump, permease component n=1 Tax=Lacticaseibacillus nasuensis JCM 17158 TaxID=1291734 RepID=A0A0R1K145_9LACO|nr:ABC transporter permease [Lacticaseibacillus nasuensis]KRK73898.1 ABC-type Na+ efflux pump, permease component [Lacticaseibacillus nasuensis JCM 17158]